MDTAPSRSIVSTMILRLWAAIIGPCYRNDDAQCGREDDSHGRQRAGAARARTRSRARARARARDDRMTASSPGQPRMAPGQPRTRASVSVLAASMTDFAGRRPGWRVSRAAGAEIDAAGAPRVAGR